MTMTDTRTTTLAGRMRTARLFAGIEQIPLAAELGVSRQTIGSWEAGTHEPSASRLIRWAELTRVSLDWLAYGSGVRPEGFEPPTYCSVVNAAFGYIWEDCRDGFHGVCDGTGCSCSCHSEPSALTLRSALGLAA